MINFAYNTCSLTFLFKYVFLTSNQTLLSCCSHYSTLYRGTSLGYKVQKLRPNTSHSFRIAASSESGQGAWLRVRSCSIACGNLLAKAILTFLHRWQMNLHEQSWPRTFHTTKEILFVKLSDGDDELVSQLRDG